MSFAVHIHDRETCQPQEGIDVYEDAKSDDSEALIDNDKKLLFQIDWHLMPWLCLLYTLALIDRCGTVSFLSLTNDRLNISSALIAGMETELHLDEGNYYNIALLVFFPGYRSVKRNL